MWKYLICTAQSRILALDAWSTSVSPQLFIFLLYVCFLCFKWPPWTWQHNSLLESMVLLMSLVQNIVYSNPTEVLILLFICFCCYSVTKLCLTTCEPHELQQALLLCPSLSLGVCSNSCPLSQWCHPTILSSLAPFSACPQFLPGSGFFPMNQLFTSDGQSIVALASAPTLPMNIQGSFPLGLTD